MMLFFLLIRYFESNFNDIQFQQELREKLDYTGVSFSECSASTIDSYQTCLKIEKSKPLTTYRLDLQNEISDEKPLWLHFTYKQNNYFGEGSIFLSGEKDGKSAFLSGVTFKTTNYVILDVNSRKEGVPILLNFGLTHTFDCIIRNRTDFSIYIDGIHHLSMNKSAPANISSFILLIHSQSSFFELGHIIIGDDPDEMIPVMINDTLVYRKLERVKYKQNLIKGKALKLFNYTYTERIPYEYIQHADKPENVDPRRFHFPYLIGYDGDDSDDIESKGKNHQKNKESYDYQEISKQKFVSPYDYTEL